MKKLVIIELCLILVLTSTLTVNAQTVTLPSVTTVSNLESIIDEYVEENKDSTASVSIAVFDSDSVQFDKVYGYSDIENKVMANDDTVYEWGSATKILTWVSVMQLVEQGKIDLDENIQNYLPNGFLKKLNYDSQITMINLMNHNAGWQEAIIGTFVSEEKDIKDLGKMLQETEPEQIFQPGKVSAYSNWGAALAGYIVECVSGEKFDDYVNNHIFKPLGMEHTGISPTLKDNEWVKEKRSELKCYDKELGSLGTCRYYITIYPAGSTVGTLEDFITFAQAMLPQDGEKSLLFAKSDTLEEMFSPTLYCGDTDKALNCHGFWTMQLSDELIWHNGGTIGCATMLCIDPTAKTGVVVMTNQSDESTVYTNGILPIVFGEYRYAQNNEGVMSDADLNGYYINAQTLFKGCLKWQSISSIVNLKVQDDKTLLCENFAATPISSNTYVADGALFMYTSVDDAGVVHLQFPAGDYIKMNKMTVYIQYILLAIMGVAIIYCMISILIMVIKFISKKNGDFQTTPLENLVNAMNFSVVLIAINLLVFICRVNLLQTMPALRWQIILTGLLALIPILNLFLLIIKYRKLECSKKVKIHLIVNACMGMIVSLNVWYWELYKFW